MSTLTPTALVRAHDSHGRAGLRIAISFTGIGVLCAGWLPYLTTIRERLHLDDATYGTLLLAGPIGVLLGIQACKPVLARWNVRTLTRLSAAGIAVCVLLAVVAPNIPVLVAALLVLGVCKGSISIAVNTAAIKRDLEAATTRPLMSLFHAMCSMGGLLGTWLAGVAIAVHISITQHLIMAGFIGCAMCWITPAYSSSSKSSVCQHAAVHTPFHITPQIWMLAVIGVLCTHAEGMAGSWAPIYMDQHARAQGSQIVFGYAGFASGMTAGRFLGPWLVARLGNRRVLMLSSLLAACGLIGLSVLPSVASGTIGFSLVGLGVANMTPVLMTLAAAQHPAEPHRAITMISTTGTLGGLAGPPLVGIVSKTASLPTAMACVGLACLLAALGTTTPALKRSGGSSGRARGFDK